MVAVATSSDMDEHSEQSLPGSSPGSPPSPELVARAVHDIDGRNHYEQRILLSDLLAAAWPAVQCQLQ
jgi:hypothetical protein